MHKYLTKTENGSVEQITQKKFIIINFGLKERSKFFKLIKPTLEKENSNKFQNLSFLLIES